MTKKVYLNLLFFYGILCQGIFAMLSAMNGNLTTDSLVRKRRVINHSPGGEHESVNYVVKIINGTRSVCQGAILSHLTVITAANCVLEYVTFTPYNVLSGGLYDSQWSFHNATSVKQYYGNPPVQRIDGIALITVNPPFVYTGKTGNIALHTGPLHEGTLINVFGWERVYPDGPETQLRHRLRTITLPIMNREECIHLYRHYVTISEKQFCTISAQQFYYRDEIGGPLVINNRLAGILTLKGRLPGQIHPDIFVNVQNIAYSQWIRAKIR